jgi:hypothetical protein
MILSVIGGWHRKALLTHLGRLALGDWIVAI